MKAHIHAVLLVTEQTIFEVIFKIYNLMIRIYKKIQKNAEIETNL